MQKPQSPLSPSAIKRAENIDLPLLGLKAISGIRDALEALEIIQIESARSKGASWDDIADAMGISRQALQQRLKSRQSGKRRPAAIHLPD